MKTHEFSLRDRMKSFRFAFEGISSFFQREQNAWLHLMATVVVFTLAALTGVTKMELVALVFSIGFVWVAEMFNTCIEKVMDFVTVHRHREVKFIKDLAAAAVLTSAITAFAVGAIIFIPKLIG